MCALVTAWPITAARRWRPLRAERLARYASRAALSTTPSPIGIAPVMRVAVRCRASSACRSVPEAKCDRRGCGKKPPPRRRDEDQAGAACPPAWWPARSARILARYASPTARLMAPPDPRLRGGGTSLSARQTAEA